LELRRQVAIDVDASEKLSDSMGCLRYSGARTSGTNVGCDDPSGRSGLNKHDTTEHRIVERSRVGVMFKTWVDYKRGLTKSVRHVSA
jgi:hypothetical protein